MSEQSKIILPDHEKELNTSLLACTGFAFLPFANTNVSHSAYSKTTVIAHTAQVQLVFVYLRCSCVFDDSAFFVFIYTLLLRTSLVAFDRV